MVPSREFSLAEARAALATLRDALFSLQDAQQRLRTVRAELQLLGRRHLNNGVVAERRVRELRREQILLGETARRLVGEIGATGVELKSIDEGLLDFPTQVDGVPSYWCWRAGEDDIEWWHPRDTGFAGRRRIEPSD
jgi:hypothetical protein